MSFIIVSDSSSNIFEMQGINYKNVPLKIISESKEYVDAPDLDVAGMVADMYRSKERFRTSCPNAFEWQEAFRGENEIFAITITSKLSGSYSAAMTAAENYKTENPDAQVWVIDSFSTGPEMELVMEKIRECDENGLSFNETKEIVTEYMNRTNLLFSLESLNNLAKNGRVNPAVAKIAGVLGIRIVGMAYEGNLKSLHKCRGAKKTVETLKEEMINMGFKGGKVRISHCLNEEGALELKEKILVTYPETDIKIIPCTALCSFYAEKGGILVGFET